jgi:ABC-type multidrug transport system fused ATPase/permease subunit
MKTMGLITYTSDLSVLEKPETVSTTDVDATTHELTGMESVRRRAASRNNTDQIDRAEKNTSSGTLPTSDPDLYSSEVATTPTSTTTDEEEDVDSDDEELQMGFEAKPRNKILPRLSVLTATSDKSKRQSQGFFKSKRASQVSKRTSQVKADLQKEFGFSYHDDTTFLPAAHIISPSETMESIQSSFYETSFANRDPDAISVRSFASQTQARISKSLSDAFKKSTGGAQLRMNFQFQDLRYVVGGSAGRNASTSSKRTKRGKVILEGVSGEIRAGRMTAVMGPSGAGSKYTHQLVP